MGQGVNFANFMRSFLSRKCIFYASMCTKYEYTYPIKFIVSR